MRWFNWILDLLATFASKPPAAPPAPGPVPDTEPPAPANPLTRMLGRHNAERMRVGLNMLRAAPELGAATRDYAELMASRNVLSHDLGQQLLPRLLSFRYSTMYAGENIGVAAADTDTAADQLFEKWMRSYGHHQNIMNPAFSDIGIGRAAGKNGWFWCVIFANPRTKVMSDVVDGGGEFTAQSVIPMCFVPDGIDLRGVRHADGY